VDGTGSVGAQAAPEAGEADDAASADESQVEAVAGQDEGDDEDEGKKRRRVVPPKDEGGAEKPKAAQPKKPQPAAHELPPEVAEIKRAAQERFNEAARIRKEAEAEAARARKIIEAAGFDMPTLIQKHGKEGARKLLEDSLFGLYEEETLTPAQLEERKAQRAAEAKEKADREEFEKWKAEQKAKAEKEAMTPFVKAVDDAVAEGLEALGEGANTPENAARVAEYLLAQLDAGQELNAKAAAQKVKADTEKYAAAHVGSLSAEDAIKRFPDLVKRIRDYDLAQAAKAPGFPTGTKPQSDTAPKQQKREKPQTVDQYFARLGA